MKFVHDDSATESGDSLQVPKEFEQALIALLRNELQFAEFRDEIANLLYTDFRYARPIETWLHQTTSEGSIPEHLLKVLVRDIHRICAEDTPTTIDTDVPQSDELDEPESKETDRSPVSLVVPNYQTESTRNVQAQPPPTAAGELSPGIEDDDESEQQVTAALVSSPVPAVGTTLCGRYELIERVAGGNMSRVFKARVTENGVEMFYAVKVLDPEMARSGGALRALLDEYEKGRAYNHPNIVRYLALERHESEIFIVMEWLEGRTLSSILNAAPGKPYPAQRSRKLLSQLADALATMHASGFVHADVKPGNVIVQPDGNLRLLDLGVACAFGKTRDERIGFDAGVLGAATPAYASADVLSLNSPEPGDDVYSFAALAYRLLSGTRVHGKATAKEASDSELQPVRVPFLSDAAWVMLERALSHDPAARPELLNLATALTEGSVPRTVKSRFRWNWKLLFGLLVVTSAALLGIYWQQTGSYEGEDLIGGTRPTAVPPKTVADDAGSPAATEAYVEPVVEAPATVIPELGGINPTEAIAENQPLRTIEAIAENQPLRTIVSGEQSVSAPLVVAGELGAFEILLRRGPEHQDLQQVNLYLSERRQSPTAHTLRLHTPGERRFSDAGELLIQLESFPAAMLAPHRDYVLSASALGDPDVSLVATTIRVSNPEVLLLATTVPRDSLSFLAAEMEAQESGGTVIVDILRLNSSGEALTAYAAIDPGSALPDEDFFQPLSQAIALGTNDENYRLIIPLLNDGIAESSEWFDIVLTAPATDPALFKRLRVTILDDDF